MITDLCVFKNCPHLGSTLDSGFFRENSSKNEKDFDLGELEEGDMSIAAQENEAYWLRS